jgi:hypothetical protein
MSNFATVVDMGSYYAVQVNGQTVFTRDDYSRCQTIAGRLNNIFSDPNRDLDFITPTYTDGYYGVCCPLVRKNVDQITYLYDSDGSNGWRSYPEKLYETTNWSDSRNSNQTAIATILPSESNVPWLAAINLANYIRNAVNLNFNDAAGRSTCQQFTVPSNSGPSTSLISSSAYCAYYGHPCQGLEPGTTSYCPELGYRVQNILNTTVGNGEVLHPQDLTCAMTSTNNWDSLYRNKFVKVTNLSTSQSIVVRVTDTAPENKGIELTYRAWVSIGKPTGSNTVKIELLN